MIEMALRITNFERAVRAITAGYLQLLTAVACLLFAAPVMAADLTALYLQPKDPEDIFGRKISSFMEAVAEDLGVKLEVFHLHQESSYVRKRQIAHYLNTRTMPDIILTHYEAAIFPDLLDIIKDKKTVCVAFNIGADANEAVVTGRARERSPNWIAHLTPDDVMAGYLLGDELIKQARKLPVYTQGQQLQVAVLGGNELGHVNADRVSGLTRHLSQMTDVVVKATKNSDWQRSQGADLTNKIIKENPEIRIFWSGSDGLALGAVDALTANGLKPGVNFVAGGIDWSDEGMQAVHDRQIAVSIGGHFMEGGWGLLLAFDYLNGHDFQDELGVTIPTKMSALTADNVDDYINKFVRPGWGAMDFKRFSKTFNQELKKYDFSMESLFSATSAVQSVTSTAAE